MYLNIKQHLVYPRQGVGWITPTIPAPPAPFDASLVPYDRQRKYLYLDDKIFYIDKERFNPFTPAVVAFDSSLLINDSKRKYLYDSQTCSYDADKKRFDWFRPFIFIDGRGRRESLYSDSQVRYSIDTRRIVVSFLSLSFTIRRSYIDYQNEDKFRYSTYRKDSWIYANFVAGFNPALLPHDKRRRNYQVDSDISGKYMDARYGISNTGTSAAILSDWYLTHKIKKKLR